MSNRLNASDPESEGFEAWFSDSVRGTRPAECPYPKGSLAWHQWCDGWDYADRTNARGWVQPGA